jgi:hypothetical protein
MAASGATAFAIAEKFKTSVETIERKARQLGISLSGIRGQRPTKKRRIGPKPKGNDAFSAHPYLPVLFGDSFPVWDSGTHDHGGNRCK